MYSGFAIGFSYYFMLRQGTAGIMIFCTLSGISHTLNI